MCDIIEINEKDLANNIECCEPSRYTLGIVTIPGLFVRINLCKKHYDQVIEYTKKGITINKEIDGKETISGSRRIMMPGVLNGTDVLVHV